MSRRTAPKKGAAQAAPASQILYCVTFEDVVTWQAFIEAPNPETAKQIAETCWKTDGFKPEHRLELVLEGCCARDYQAEEVPL